MSKSPERTSIFSRIRHDRSESPRHNPIGKGRRERGVFNRLGAKERVRPHTRKAATRVPAQEEWNQSLENVTMKERVHEGQRYSPKVCEETCHFTPCIRYFDFPKKTRMPNNVKTYDGSDDPEDHLKIFQAATKVERWAMPTCYDDLKKAFLANFLQQKKCIKDPVEIHQIKQRKGESTKDFVQRFKVESRHVKGAPECIKISEFMHGITNPELIKRLHDNIPKSVDEIMRVTTTFLRGEVAASNQQRSEQRRDNFKLLIKSSKEILALDKGKFKTSPPMITPVEKRNNNKFCEFHGEVGHNTDERKHPRRQIKELIKARNMSHVIKELKQGSGKDQPKATKNGETSGKDKPLAILMVQPWQRVSRQRITQSFSPNLNFLFPSFRG
ncbi:reverse transcriptase domain-containing protein [Tanacetum coccineum]